MIDFTPYEGRLTVHEAVDGVVEISATDLTGKYGQPVAEIYDGPEASATELATVFVEAFNLLTAANLAKHHIIIAEDTLERAIARAERRPVK